MAEGFFDGFNCYTCADAGSHCILDIPSPVLFEGRGFSGCSFGRRNERAVRQSRLPCFSGFQNCLGGTLNDGCVTVAFQSGFPVEFLVRDNFG